MFQLNAGSDPDGVQYRRPKRNKRLQISGNLTERKARVNTLTSFHNYFFVLTYLSFYNN